MSRTSDEDDDSRTSPLLSASQCHSRSFPVPLSHSHFALSLSLLPATGSVSLIRCAELQDARGKKLGFDGIVMPQILSKACFLHAVIMTEVCLAQPPFPIYLHTSSNRRQYFFSRGPLVSGNSLRWQLLSKFVGLLTGPLRSSMRLRPSSSALPRSASKQQRSCPCFHAHFEHSTIFNPLRSLTSLCCSPHGRVSSWQ